MPLWRCMSLIANNDIQLSGYSTCRESAIRRRGSYFRMHFLSCYQFFWTVLGWTLDIMRISLVPWKNDIYSNSSHSHGLKFMRHEEHCDHSLKFSSDAAKYSGSYLGRQTLSKSPSPPYYLPPAAEAMARAWALQSSPEERQSRVSSSRRVNIYIDDQAVDSESDNSTTVD
jgi:hypothetical protein